MGDRGINFAQDFQPMRLRRSRVEEIVDKTLQLYLINCVNEKGWLGGITKLMKLLFFAEKEMVESNIKGFNYSFYRWQFGPFTPEVYQDLEYLLDNKLVTDEDKPELTSRGKAFLKSIEEFLEENRAITSCVDAIAEKYAHEWGK